MKQWAESHETLDQQRFVQVHSSLKLITTVGGWVLTLLVVTVLGVLGWSLNQQYEANRRTVDAIQQSSDQAADKAAKRVQSQQQLFP